MNKMRTLALPEDLCRAVEERFSQTFGSLEECTVALLTELLRDDAAVCDEREKQIIENRLKALGYV
jgi:hypothetical protein